MGDVFLRCAAAGIVCVIVSLTLRGRNCEIALVLTLACCCMIGLSALSLLKPVVEFLDKLRMISNLDGQMMGILLKIVGIGFIGEIVSAVCADSGNASIGKTLQILATAVILYLSLPLFTALLQLVERIMGNI